MEWFSWVVAIILFFSSIISPWLVTRENNKHQLSIKKLDIYEKSKINAISNFITSSCSYWQSCTIETSENLDQSIIFLNLYFKEIPTLVCELRNQRTDSDFFSVLTSIVQDLSKQIAKE